MRVSTIAVAIGLLSVCAPTMATDVDVAAAQALAKRHNCLQCHAVDKKVLGPAYKDVAKRYRGNRNAPAQLLKSVRAGSKGLWGVTPMPPNDKVTPAEAASLVDWILAMH